MAFSVKNDFPFFFHFSQALAGSRLVYSYTLQLKSPECGCLHVGDFSSKRRNMHLFEAALVVWLKGQFDFDQALLLALQIFAL